jgi:hypothetical protein
MFRQIFQVKYAFDAYGADRVHVCRRVLHRHRRSGRSFDLIVAVGSPLIANSALKILEIIIIFLYICAVTFDVQLYG